MKQIRILNFDNSITVQKRLTSFYNPQVVDLSQIGPKARLWADKNVKTQIQEQLTALPKVFLNFIGSGDFHHITSILLSQYQQPLSLIVFDFHPDWDAFPPRFACGAWVSEVMRKNSNILSAVLIGVSSDDISGKSLLSADFALLKNNRLQIYPYSRKPSRVFLKRPPDNISIKLERNYIYWSQLQGEPLEGVMRRIINRLPVKDVYISIDKDCLKKAYAVTNWEEGFMSLDELLRMLKVILGSANVIGMDITGDYSKADISGLWKKFCYNSDHPKDFTANGIDEASVTQINENTNLKMLEVLLGSA